MQKRTMCPAREQETLRPIIYGSVTDPDVLEKAWGEELVLGGCMIGEDSPKWECPKCGRRWKDQEVG